MDLRFNPETLEVLQTSDYGLRAAKSSPWTVFLSLSCQNMGIPRSICDRSRLRCWGSPYSLR